MTHICPRTFSPCTRCDYPAAPCRAMLDIIGSVPVPVRVKAVERTVKS